MLLHFYANLVRSKLVLRSLKKTLNHLPKCAEPDFDLSKRVLHLYPINLSPIQQQKFVEKNYALLVFSTLIGSFNIL